jgi:hypothetical protein
MIGAEFTILARVNDGEFVAIGDPVMESDGGNVSHDLKAPEFSRNGAESSNAGGSRQPLVVPLADWWRPRLCRLAWEVVLRDEGLISTSLARSAGGLVTPAESRSGLDSPPRALASEDADGRSWLTHHGLATAVSEQGPDPAMRHEVAAIWASLTTITRGLAD